MTFRQQYLYGDDPVELNEGRRTARVTVSNTGDRAVQVGSHYHFFEVNSALSFDREATLGMHLNIAAGTSVRFEPGGTREVELCAYAGTGRLTGFSGLLNGSLSSHPARVEAVRRAIERGFQGAQRAAAASGSKGSKGAQDSKGSKESKGDSKGAKAAKDKKKGSR